MRWNCCCFNACPFLQAQEQLKELEEMRQEKRQLQTDLQNNMERVSDYGLTAVHLRLFQMWF